MADIRELIKDDRGFIKKIQAFLPGYKKYRNCEDLRSADNMLRLELGKKLRLVESNIAEARDGLARKMDLENINVIGELSNRSHALTERVKHAEQGYSPWISGDVRIEEEELQKLYEFDLVMFEKVEELIRTSSSLSDLTGGNGGNMKDLISSVNKAILDFDRSFSERISTVTRVAQKK